VWAIYLLLLFGRGFELGARGFFFAVRSEGECSFGLLGACRVSFVLILNLQQVESRQLGIDIDCF
jgi:hypothetical protein